jgi:hypothetical protein
VLGSVEILTGKLTHACCDTFKNLPVTERVKAQFRVEMFNIFNRLNLAPPNGYLFGGFGASTDTIGDYNGAPGIGPGEPFNMQLALKLIF